MKQLRKQRRTSPPLPSMSSVDSQHSDPRSGTSRLFLPTDEVSSPSAKAEKEKQAPLAGYVSPIHALPARQILQKCIFASD